MGRDNALQEPKNRINKALKRDNILKEGLSDVKLNDRTNSRFANKKKEKGSKPTIKSIQVSSIKLLGHYETDIDGKNLIMDGPEGIRIYSLPTEMKISLKVQSDDSDRQVVDDWEQLADEDNSTAKPSVASQDEVIIPDCNDIEFNLLQGYKDGGNRISYSGRKRDRTPCIRWMVKNHRKIQCKDGTRLFDVDFMIRNEAVRKVMGSQFDHYAKETQVAVIRFMDTYFVWDVKHRENENELNNKRSFAGLRFEDYVSRGMDGRENKPSSGDKNNYADSKKYYNVVRLKFGDHQMLVAGETDCVLPGSVDDGKTPNLSDFIELKTSAPLEDKYDQSKMSPFFRCGKTISWFTQCALLGMKYVVVGIREEYGDQMICRKTRAFTLDELRQHSDGSWSKNRCFDALNKFLYIVKEKVTENNSDDIYVFIIKEGKIMDPVKKNASEDVHLPDISEIVPLLEDLQRKI